MGARNYCIIFIDFLGNKREWNFKGYSVKQAKYVFKLYNPDYKEIVHIGY